MPKPTNHSEALKNIAKDFIDKKVADGTIVPDAAAAVTNAGVPSFSAGTVALDENTGKPIVSHETVAPQSVLDKTTPIPIVDDAEAGAAREAAAAGQTAPAAPRDTKTGQFKSEKTPAPAPKVAPTTPKTPEQKVESAEDAASAILDEWSDVEDMVFEHDDGSKYPVRTPKKYAKQVARFNERQAQKDRAANWLGRYRPTLEPLITSGRLDGILPHIQRALQDPGFADYVSQGYNRLMIGQPLAPPQQPQQPPQFAPPPVQAPTGLPEGTDPFLAEQVGPLLAPIMEQNRQLQARLDQWQQQQQTQMDQQRQREQQDAQNRQLLAAAHQDLALIYPGSFTGNLSHDQAQWDNVLRYAKDGGYIQSMGLHRGIIRAAQQLQAERADLASPAAAMLAQVDSATLRAAQAQAASARSVGGGSTSTPAPQPKAPLKPPTTRDANGKLKTPRQMMAEAQQYAAQVVGQA